MKHPPIKEQQIAWAIGNYFLDQHNQDYAKTALVFYE
jgi:hypothetical protein